MQKSSGLIVIASPNQSLENRFISGMRNQVNCAAIGNRGNRDLVSTEARKKGSSFSGGAEDER